MKAFFLQTTSPIRADADIEGAVSIWEEYKPGSVVSASPAGHSPYYTILEKEDDGTLVLSKQLDNPLVRRQDSPECWAMNGAVYVFDSCRYFEARQSLYPDSRLYSMPEERSIDIDSELDWKISEMLFEKCPRAGRRPPLSIRRQQGPAHDYVYGMADQVEIMETVADARRAGGDELCLLHCTSGYPIPGNEADLRMLPLFAQRYDVIRGCPTIRWNRQSRPRRWRLEHASSKSTSP